MDGRSLEELRDELQRLMREQADSLTRQTFLGITPGELAEEKARLLRIREVSADFLEALKQMHR